MPEGVDTKAMLPRAVTARVAYASGTGFYADGFGSRQLRLSYCYPTPERITEGVRRLAGVLEAELDVIRTFGSAAPAAGRRSADRRPRRRTPPELRRDAAGDDAISEPAERTIDCRDPTADERSRAA